MPIGGRSGPAKPYTDRKVDGSSRARVAMYALGVGFALILALPLMGLVYEAIAEVLDSHRYRPLGRLVDIGGRRLHIYCVGEGSPTVVLESGRGSFSFDWARVQPVVAGSTRVCAYDRASYAWSDPNRAPRTLQDIANELHTLLVNAEIPGPYVLVGHSMGGLIVRLFADKHLESVAGMVLVDSMHEDSQARLPDKNRKTPARPPSRWRLPLPPTIVRRLGILRLWKLWQGADGMPAIFRKLPPTIQSARLSFMIHPDALHLEDGEGVPMAESLAQIRATREKAKHPLGTIPLVVVSSDTEVEQVKRVHTSLQSELASLSANGRHVVARRSGHFIQLDQPGLVVKAICDVVEAARTLSGLHGRSG